jgi:HD-GYP domain-containing protein (c-di-GMP phosphodiesterase class II)
MLKKINVDQLRLGMFLHELCGSWMDHPFWNTRFLLDNPKDIGRIRDCGIKEVWIDTGKGIDVEGEAGTGETRAEAEERMEQELLEATLGPTEPVSAVALEMEIAKATRICARAKTAVTSMFAEARMGQALKAERMTPLVEDISASVSRNPGAFVSLARLKTKDDYTYMHSVAVCALMVALARQLGLGEEETRAAGLAGLLHDLGKAAIDLAILNKPGKLTDAEFETVKGHPAAGHRMLLDGSGAGDVPLDVCRHHHEKIDGSGYPDRLAGDAISLYAKMGAVCDVYDAITSNRPYKSGWNPAEALRKMNEWSKGHFDQRIFHHFVKAVGIYPTGSLVRLESGLLAVVLETSDRALLTPEVKAFYCTRRKQRILPQVIDLAAAGAEDKIASWESPEKWNFPDLDELWSGRSGPI